MLTLIDNKYLYISQPKYVHACPALFMLIQGLITLMHPFVYDSPLQSLGKVRREMSRMSSICLINNLRESK